MAHMPNQYCCAACRVVKTLQVMGELIQQAPLNIWQGQSMQANITFFYDALGGCERILRVCASSKRGLGMTVEMYAGLVCPLCRIHNLYDQCHGRKQRSLLSS